MKALYYTHDSKKEHVFHFDLDDNANNGMWFCFPLSTRNGGSFPHGVSGD
ncbi:MAG: hypothetical protein HYZ69_01770 [Candidatus Colwellbacteria bacterium]|nr:hypothetical protein [Candidatus Colwellbacteria bacterium]